MILALQTEILLMLNLLNRVQGFVPVIAEMLIHFRFGEKRALLGQENSKGHAEFFLEFMLPAKLPLSVKLPTHYH